MSKHATRSDPSKDLQTLRAEWCKLGRSHPSLQAFQWNKLNHGELASLAVQVVVGEMGRVPIDDALEKLTLGVFLSRQLTGREVSALEDQVWNFVLRDRSGLRDSVLDFLFASPNWSCEVILEMPDRRRMYIAICMSTLVKCFAKSVLRVIEESEDMHFSVRHHTFPASPAETSAWKTVAVQCAELEDERSAVRQRRTIIADLPP